MSCCHDTPCYKCDPGIEAFYQVKVKEAQEAAAYLATTGCIVGDYHDLLDAKDIWYEYCALRAQEQADNLHDSDELYSHYFLVKEPGWHLHGFCVWDAWEVNRIPMITAKYDQCDKEFYLRIHFEGEDYSKVSGFELLLNNENVLSQNNLSWTLSDFFLMSPKGEILDGSEKKCIDLINKYYNAKDSNKP